MSNKNKWEPYTRHLKHLLVEVLPKAKKPDYRVKGLPLTVIVDYLHSRIRKEIEVGNYVPQLEGYRFLMSPMATRIIKQNKFYVTISSVPTVRGRILKRMCNAQIVNSYDGCGECDIRLKCLASGRVPSLEVT